MNTDTVVGLMKELTAKLSAVAGEFDQRLTDMVRPVEKGDGDVLSSAMLINRANTLLAERRLRRQHLPAELFHEPAWDMLLALFVAGEDPQPMNIKALVAMADAPVTTSQRWIEHLYKLRLIDRVIDPADRRRVEISLSAMGQDAVTSYLRAVTK
ncbi:MAG: MarR family transcriptional regulator [Oxalobacteraceae bacterium]|jgi:DNA-binding MarR family transcriptional regulator|nr:MAG: MarR family transcriptional regulator [Oxalobacteraceae bacterium]